MHCRWRFRAQRGFYTISLPVEADNGKWQPARTNGAQYAPSGRTRARKGHKGEDKDQAMYQACLGLFYRWCFRAQHGFCTIS